MTNRGDSVSTGISLDGVRYKDLFLFGLVGASLLPAAICVVDFEITNRAFYAFTLLFSLIALLGGLHVWITLAYYFDRQWIALFNERPLIFYVAPIALLLGAILLLAQPLTSIGLALVCTLGFINLWHHGKQNWGILTLVGRNRGINVEPMRKPLVYAWPFFAIPFCMYLPELRGLFGVDLLYRLGLATTAAYFAFCAAALWRRPTVFLRDPAVLVFSIALCLYFVPLVALYGKPYSLLVFGGAHALQYYLLVFASMSFRARRSIDARSIVMAVCISITLLTVVTVLAHAIVQGYVRDTAMWDSVAVRLIVGFVSGVNLIHFWLDAFIWRLSDKRVRMQHGDTFAF